MNTILRRISELEPAPPWGLVTGVAYLFAMFVTFVGGTLIAGTLLGQTPLGTVAGWSLGAIVIAIAVVVIRNRTPQDREALGLGDTQATLPIILLLSIGVAIMLDVISLAVTRTAWVVPELLPFFDIRMVSPIVPLAVGIPAWIVGVLFVVVFQPIAEELVLRGVAYPALRTGLGAWMGFIMTAVFHAMFHLLAYTSNPQSNVPFIWYALILPLIDGLYLTGVRAYTRSTRAAVVAHIGLGIFAVLRALVLAG